MVDCARDRCNPLTAVYPSAVLGRPRPQRRACRGLLEIEQPDMLSGRTGQCPRCGAAAAAPVASAQQPGCVIAHHWRCDCCECEWESVFQPLLV